MSERGRYALFGEVICLAIGVGIHHPAMGAVLGLAMGLAMAAWRNKRKI